MKALLLLAAAAAVQLDARGGYTCGVADGDVAAAVAAWPPSCAGQLRLYVDPNGLSGMTGAEFIDAAAEACRNCSAVSGLHIDLTNDKAAADIALAAQSQRSGILAWCEFPTNSCANQVQTRFNSRVKWSRPLFLDTLVHELGHGFGLPHTSDKRDIMYPSIIQGRGLNGRYGPHYSIPQLVARYGENDGVIPRPDSPIPLPPIGKGWDALLSWAWNMLLTLAAGYLGGKYHGDSNAERRIAELRRAYASPPGSIPPV